MRLSLSGQDWGRLAAMFGVIAALHVIGWGTLILVAVPEHHTVGGTALGIGIGLTAYTLGLRHAFDADHIAAIDNTTRKLMAANKRPISVGFWFSLGHSSVVLALAVLLNFGIRALDSQVKNGSSNLHQVTNIVGTSVSGFFLYLIAVLNIVVLVSIVRVFRDMRRGVYNDDELEEQLNKRGLMNRFFGGLSRRIDRPWKMYPIGILFGLGFDTATEVALLVLSGTAVASGLPFYGILALPLLFAAGMSLLDTTDGCFMNFAYGWAFSRPLRKVYYNITITGLSIAVAFLIGTVEIVGLITQEVKVRGSLATFFQNFNINTAGYFIVGLFVVTWLGALAVWRFARVEERWDQAALHARSQRELAEHDVSPARTAELVRER